jgi:hypothetical protein
MATYQLPNGTTVSDLMAFTYDDIHYPENWIRLSTEEDRERIGLTGPLPEPPWYDQQFYWGPDQPKDHGELVELYCGFVKLNANAILRETDWYITRFSETGLAAPQSVLDRRSEVRVLSNQKETFLRSTASTQELAEYVTSPEYSRWESPSTEEPEIIEPIEEPLIYINPVFTGGNGINSGSSNVYSN